MLMQTDLSYFLWKIGWSEWKRLCLQQLWQRHGLGDAQVQLQFGRSNEKSMETTETYFIRSCTDYCITDHINFCTLKWNEFHQYVHCSNSIMKKERQTRKGWMSSRQDREKWRMTLIWHAKHCKLPFYEGISLRCFLRDKWSAIPRHTHLERDPKSDCCDRALHVVPCYQLFSLSIF